eukprot:sb/3478464/
MRYGIPSSPPKDIQLPSYSPPPTHDLAGGVVSDVVLNGEQYMNKQDSLGDVPPHKRQKLEPPENGEWQKLEPPENVDSPGFLLSSSLSLSLSLFSHQHTD